MRTAHFIGSLLLLSAIGWDARAQAQGAGADPAAEAFPDRVIDVHTHSNFDGRVERSSGIPYSKEQFLKEMKEAGVVGAVSHEYPGLTGPDLRDHNVIRCFGLKAQVDTAALEAGLKSGRFNCMKVYLGYMHQYAYDANYHPAYRLAEKYDVPVVFHTGDTYSTVAKVKYADPLTIDEVAVDFPKVRFVIAHCGNPWIQPAAEVAYKNPNVYIECSAMLVGKISQIQPEILNRSMVSPISWIFGYVGDPKKFMYGSDWPLAGMKDYLAVYKRAIPEKHWQAVFHDNPVRVFKLKDAER